MNCKNCGHPLSAQDTFCAYCGAQVEHEMQSVASVPEAQAGGPVKTKKKNGKLKLAIVLIVLVLVLSAALTVMILILQDKKLKEPIVIDLNNYISTECLVSEGNPYATDSDTEEPVSIRSGFKNDSRGAGLIITGYNTYASIKQSDLSNVIKWGDLLEDFKTAIQQKKGYESKEFTDYFKFNDFSFSADKLNNIGNEDTIKITVKVSGKESYTFEDITIQFIGADVAARVSGLTTVQAVDPFAYVNLVSDGANGEARLEIKVDEDLDEPIKGLKDYRAKRGANGGVDLLKGSDIVASFSYSLGDDGYGSDHKNGEIVTMTCECPETNDLISKHKIYIANFSKEYKLSGLGDYLKKDFKMSDEDLKKYNDYAQKAIDEYYKDSSDITNISIKNVYLWVKNDVDYPANSLYFIFSYDYKTYDDKIETRYGCVEFVNLTEFDGKLTTTPDESHENYIRDGYEKISEFTDRFGSEYTMITIK